ncbi:MAG: GTP 3',8-cyclase MoaA [Rhodothermales bacterium]|nr:GTP 3',8-cyclase MoaA [Rhodothermales bacterium]MBO6778499.1 GTP 3',8-cyclase MoaA [Rhodothermales bacterium]
MTAPSEHSPAPLLTDTFARFHDYLRIALTERCNLRCVYCMPAAGVPLKPRADMLTFEEIERLARFFAERGVRKIRLTGGEPLVRKDAVELVRMLAALPGIETLAMTTNGLLLEQKLPDLKDAGLTHLNISLDTLREDRFREMTRRPGLDRVLGAIDAALAHGYSGTKVNCVVLRGSNEDELLDFAAMSIDRPLGMRFIEYMPFSGNGWDSGELVPYAEMLERVRDRWPRLEPIARGANAVSTDWRIPGARGTVGFISSMTDKFCGSCNRIRLTADGRLRNCLFGQDGVSLRDALRAGATDAELEQLVASTVRAKKAAHAGMFALADRPDRPMILIGG